MPSDHAGKHTREAQRAWREKIGLVSLNLGLMAVVGFVTFGFTQTVCGEQGIRIKGGQADTGYLLINGYAYDFANWSHPAAGTYFNGTTNPLYSDAWKAGGMDASFLFQKVNENCKGIITAASGSSIAQDPSTGDLGWYFPCNLHDQNGTSVKNITGYESATNCHASKAGRNAFYEEKSVGQVYYNWGHVKNESRNLAVYEK
jgi:chitin synthase